ncbi:protocadherin Fat 4-like [Saccostrea echinata]|uniref:protocadherin Fat 4-like n=1 Tax=Saccostrea echinata TaxID=191078 RepID=UPI002A8343CF|nr:protocadherin Fat 4-like [Saccostrea echinata]
MKLMTCSEENYSSSDANDDETRFGHTFTKGKTSAYVNNFLAPMCLPFGLKSAPQVFTKCTKPLNVFPQNSRSSGSNLHRRLSVDSTFQAQEMCTKVLKVFQQAGFFKINSDGEVTLNQTIDYEDGEHSFILTVKATDRNDSSLTSTCKVMISLKDVNDEKPKFQQRVYKFSVGENQAVGTEVGEVRAVDKDSDSVLQYSMDPGNENFCLNSTSGIITTNTIFDFENTTSYNFTVSVSDGNQSDVATVSVEIRDMNDNAPVFNASVYKAYIPENSTNKTILRNISASDRDEGQTVTYALKNKRELFSIDKTTGVLFLKNDHNTLDYERQQTYVLQLIAKDDGQPPLSGEATVEVHLTNVDDTCPVFSSSLYTVAIKENKTYNDILQVSGQVSAQDKDTPPYKLVYQVKNNEKFTFNGNKLVLENQTTLDVDNDQSTDINLTVTVTDNSIRSCNSTSVIRITVENINDNPPVINTSSCLYPIAQNSSGPLCSVSATDADLNSGSFTFFLTQSYGIFSIDTDTGELSVLPDKALKANFTYNVSLVVSDHGSPPLRSKAVIKIFVIAANNFSPVFSNKTVTVDVKEHLFPHSVYNMTATDHDNGKEGEIMYKLVEGDTAFKINPLTGEITLNRTLKCDRHDKHYTLKVEAKDQGFNPMSSTGTVTVNVINVNEEPEFKDIVFDVCVNPPIKNNTSIAKVTAKDFDSKCTGNKEDDQVTYSLIDPSQNFKINDHGEIFTAQNIASQNFNFSLQVIATDVHELNSSKTYFISSGRKGEPVIKPKVNEVNISENHTRNTIITKINATGDGKISYNIIKISKLRDAFKIDSNTGEISLLRELDREKDGDRIDMVIQASNENGNCNSQVIIHIEDVNNKSPYFTGIPYNLQIEENSFKTHRCLLTLFAKDLDLNEKLNFSIVNANLNVFKLSTVDGQPNQAQACLQINRTLDAETDPKDISLQVGVSDGIHSNDTEVKITVMDINDNLPKFNQTSYSFNVSEGVSLGGLDPPHNISAYDRDGLDKNKLRYEIIPHDNQSLPFELDPKTGALSVGHKLDRENKSFYSFEVSVQDSWKNHTASTWVNITVFDVNDNTPTFVNKNMIYSVSEGEYM